MRWGRGAPPVPAAAGVNLLRSPAPGGGGGREGEGARAAGGSARGRRTRQRTGPARNRPEPPRAGGGAAGAPPPRNGPRAAEGGMAGRAPCGALARQGGGRGCRDRPGAARERPRRGRGQATADPRQRRGLPMRPTLVRPGADPLRGRARGKRGTERGPGRREPPQGGPAAAAPRRPAARSTIHKGRRPAQKESAQAVAWTLPGRKTLGRVNPLRVYRTTAAALLSSPRRGRPLT